MTTPVTRRTFTKVGATAALGLTVSASGTTSTAASTRKVVGANNRIRIGVLGVANRGCQLIDAFMRHDDMEIVALCDVDQQTLARAKAKYGGTQDTYRDFRKLIARDDIDAVVVATPDHWHAIQTIDACKARKDVYVEKPVSLTVAEGRRMVDVARSTDRIVQVGTHRRSGKIFTQAAKMVADGVIGKVTVARAFHRSNMYPNGMGKSQPSPPPAKLDWDMWLGPRPERPYQDNIAPYKFRWWKEFDCQISNNGVHSLDLIRWMMAAQAPTSVCCMGGKYIVDDDRTIPDTAETIFEFPEGWLLLFGMYEANGNPTMARGGLFELRGTQGTLFATDRTIEIVPERGGQFQDPAYRMEPVKVKGTDGDITAQHARNFLDCVRSRKTPNADIEEGHRSTVMSLLSKISLAVGKRLQWDPKTEQFLDCPEANAMLHYEYRAPWKLG